jgi:hypothetical protein
MRPVVSPADAARARRHHFWIVAGALVCLAIAVAFSAHGFAYYILPAPARLVSPLHPQLKPSGTLGHPVSIGASVLLCLMFLYPLRKKWKWLSKKGKTKNWLDYHILMGLTAPALITFHSAFKLQGIAGAAYWVMMSVVVSGIIGRYLYRLIPRKLGAVEMSLGEIEQHCASLASELQSQKLLSERDLQPLFELPPIGEVRAMPLPKALAVIIRLDVRRALLLLRLRFKASLHADGRDDLRRVLAAVSQHAVLSRDALFLSKAHRLFHKWHVVHRPFSYSLVVFGLLHIAVVTYLGYY